MRSRVVIILVGMAALAGLAVFLDGGSLREALRYAGQHPLALISALVAYTGAFVLRAFSWRPLIGRELPVARLFSLLLAALFLNHAAPAKAGDLARIYGATRFGVPGGRAAASVILARLVDLVGLLIVLSGTWALAGGARWWAIAVPALVVTAAAFAIWWITRTKVKLPVWLGRFGGPIDKVRRALRETRPRALTAAFVWAVPAWLLEAGILLFAARGLDMEIGPAAVVTASCFAVLVAAVPLTPGAIGTYEAGMVFVLASFGVPAETALAAAVLTHGVKFLYAFAAAPLAILEGVAAARPHEKLRPGKVQPDEASL